MRHERPAPFKDCHVTYDHPTHACAPGLMQEAHHTVFKGLYTGPEARCLPLTRFPNELPRWWALDVLVGGCQLGETQQRQEWVGALSQGCT